MGSIVARFSVRLRIHPLKRNTSVPRVEKRHILSALSSSVDTSQYKESPGNIKPSPSDHQVSPMIFIPKFKEFKYFLWDVCGIFLQSVIKEHNTFKSYITMFVLSFFFSQHIFRFRLFYFCYSYWWAREDFINREV